MSKKVLIIINKLGVGGAERVVVDDANEFAKRGFDTCIVTLAEENPSATLAGEIRGPHTMCIPIKKLYHIRGIYRLAVLLKRRKPDIVMSHLWYENTIVRLISLFVSIRCLITFEQNVYDTVKSRKQFLIDRLLQSRSHHIIAVSSAVKQSLIAHSIWEDRITVIPNAVDIGAYQHIKPIDKTEVGLQEHDFVYLFVGRLIEQKAVDVLIRAFALTSHGKLLLVGDGVLRSELQSLVHELGIHDKVFFLGIRYDIPRLMVMSDCFILPSRYEGLGVVVLEAMAAGTPVIITDFEAGKTMIQDGYNGTIVPIDDVQGLSRAMEQYYVHRDDARVLAKRARETVTKFSIEKHVDQIIHIL